MKTEIIYFLFCILFITTFTTCYPQITPEDQQAIDMLKEYYSARSTLRLTILDQDKLDSLQNRYCTKKLIKKINKICNESGLEPDILTKDYGIDSLGFKTLTISKDSIRENVYFVSYSILAEVVPNICKKEIKVIIPITVKKENGIIKMDEIE